MYKVITFRSRQLKKRTIKLDAADFSAADFDKKNKKKNKKKGDKDKGNSENVFIIQGQQVYEEDLTDEEKADIQANAILNQDGFYTMLEPLDADSQESIHRSIDKKKAILIGGAVTIIVGTLGVMAYFIISAL